MTGKYDFIKTTFNLCTKPSKASDVMWIADEVSGALGTMAMVNYPYASEFMGNLPANPVNGVCAKCFQSGASQDGSIQNLACALEFMDGKPEECVDIPDPDAQPAPGDDVWGLQVCNEMVMPFSQSETTDMFLKETWDANTFAAQCLQ